MHQCMFPTKHNQLYKIIIIVPLLISIFNQGCCGDLHRPESVQPKSRVQKTSEFSDYNNY